MDNKALKLVAFCDQLKSRKQNWNDHWDEVLEYTLPHKNRVYNHTKGEQRGQRLYDSSPQHYVELLGSALHSMLTNPAVQWFGLGTGIPKIDRKTVNQKYIQETVAIVHDTLNATNFQTEIHELYLDLASLGTGCMLIEEDEDTLLRFLTIPIYEVDIAENSKGIVETACRKIKMNNQQAIEKYGEKAFPEDKLRKLKEKPNDDIEILHLVMEREGAELNKLTPQNKKFASYHIWGAEKVLLKESGYDRFPYVIPRWTKLGNEVYGRSPAMKTLPDIRMLNQMMKTVIRGAQKAVDPPFIMAHDSVLGRLNLTAGGVTAARHGMMDGIRPLVSGSRVDIGMDMVDRVRLNVKQGFFIDQLQLGGSDRMTELEVNIRNDENLRLLSPILGRLHNELLDPLVGRVMTVMMAKKKLPENTPLDLAENQLVMHYRSQIAKAQTANEGRILTGFIGELAQLAETMQKPELMDVINFEEVVKIKASLDSVNMAIFNTEEDTEMIQEQRGQANANAQQIQEDNMNADTAQKAAKAQAT